MYIASYMKLIEKHNIDRKQHHKKSNPRTGSNFDDVLKADGLYDEVTVKALTRAISGQLKEAMIAKRITKVALAARK
jgi:hypothetical protein